MKTPADPTQGDGSKCGGSQRERAEGSRKSAPHEGRSDKNKLGAQASKQGLYNKIRNKRVADTLFDALVQNVVRSPEPGPTTGGERIVTGSRKHREAVQPPKNYASGVLNDPPSQEAKKSRTRSASKEPPAPSRVSVDPPSEEPPKKRKGKEEERAEGEERRQSREREKREERRERERESIQH